MDRSICEETAGDDTTGDERGDTPREPAGVDPLVRDGLSVLGQGRRLLCALTDDGYASVFHSGASVGAHIRHVLDHYLSLRRGFTNGEVDYDRRDRDPRVETDREFAAALLDELRAWLAGLDDKTLSVPLTVRLRTGGYAESDGGAWPSSPRRELHFAMTHAIHHYAVVASDLRSRGLAVEPGLGIAPATLGYRRGAA